MTDNVATDKLQDGAEEAASIILELMRSATSEQVKLDAARAVLNCGEMASRMSRLERAMEEKKWSLPGNQGN